MRENNSKQTILECALKLFSEKGYEGTSPNEIAELAGIKKPTLYYFFGSKEGLFEELLKTYYDRLDTLLRTNCIYDSHSGDYYKDVYPALLQTVNVHFQFAREHTEFYLMVLSMAFLPPSSKTAAISGKYHVNQYYIVQNMFESIATTHHNMKGKEQLYALRLLALINTQIGLWNRGHGELNQEIAESMVRGFMHGIFS